MNRLLGKVKTFDTLRYYRNFRLLWISNLLYQVGFWMLTLVMSWLAYEYTNSVFLVALFAAIRLSPHLLGPFSGAIADRVNRRKIIVTVLLLQMVLAGTSAILISAGLFNFWLLTVIGFLGGATRIVAYTTIYALTMDIVGKEDITNATALNVVAMNITRVIGPALGGILIAAFGPANCFWLVAVWGILAVIVLFMVQTPARKTAASQESMLSDLVKGFRYVIHHRDMLSVLVVTFSSNLLVWSAYQSFIPVFAKDNLGLGPDGLGFLFTAIGAGALTGAMIIASLGNFKRKGSLFLWGTALFGVFFSIFALSQSFAFAMFWAGLSGLASSAFGTMQTTLMLTLAPEDMRARCLGFLAMAIGVLPFGCIAIGAIANAIGASLTTVISCTLMVITVLAISIAAPNLRRLA